MPKVQVAKKSQNGFYIPRKRIRLVKVRKIHIEVKRQTILLLKSDRSKWGFKNFRE